MGGGTTRKVIFKKGVGIIGGAGGRHHCSTGPCPGCSKPKGSKDPELDIDKKGSGD